MAFPTGWGRRATVTIGAAQVSGAGALSDFSFLATVDNLPSEMFDADGSNPALAGGGDIRFSSDEAGSVQLAIDVVDFTIDNNPALGTAEIRVKAASIDDSDVFYVWYDKTGETQPAVGAAFGRDAVWADYEAVWHLDNAGDGTAGEFVDSTGNGHDGTGSGTLALSGGGVDFDGTEHIDCGASVDMTASEVSVQVEFIPDDVSAQRVLFSGDSQAQYSSLWLVHNSSGKSIFRTGDDTGISSGDRRTTVGATTLVNATRYSMTTTLESPLVTVADVNLYLDGAFDEASSSGSADFSLCPAYRADEMWFGATSSAPTSQVFNGRMFEIRLRLSVLSADWLETEQNNRSAPGTFASAGTPETPGDGVTIPVFDRHYRSMRA